MDPDFPCLSHASGHKVGIAKDKSGKQKVWNKSTSQNLLGQTSCAVVNGSAPRPTTGTEYTRSPPRTRGEVWYVPGTSGRARVWSHPGEPMPGAECTDPLGQRRRSCTAQERLLPELVGNAGETSTYWKLELLISMKCCAFIVLSNPCKKEKSGSHGMVVRGQRSRRWCPQPCNYARCSFLAFNLLSLFSSRLWQFWG